MEWLLAPIDPARAHEVGLAISWHARVMVLAWGVLAPLAVLIARYFKVMPGQKWPRELDNQVWWRSHWMGQSLVVGLSVFALVLVLPTDWSNVALHTWCGYGLLVAMVLQVLVGVCRGSKGGPTAPSADGSPRGHHYDMTPHRRAFETVHKALGYATLALGVVTIFLGLWQVNAPVWMWGALILWWIGLCVAFVVLQARGMAIDTYQAIWGDDPAHPGNQRPDPGWGVRRLGNTKGEPHVRSDRRDRVRGH